MAATHPTVALTKFSGLTSECWTDFESLFRSMITVANVGNDRQCAFLQIHLTGSALQFYQTLPQATKENLDLSLAALRNHYHNPNLREVHLIELEGLKFDPKTQTPEQFLVKIQSQAKLAYPDAVNAEIAAADPALNADAEAARIEREEAENNERTRFHTRERERQIRKLFIKNMPNWLRIKLMEKPENLTVQELCTIARRSLVLRQLCPVDDWSRDAFAELDENKTDQTSSALAKMTESQTKMENQLEARTKQLDGMTKTSPQGESSKPQNSYKNRGNTRFQSRGRSNYRGNQYNRGNSRGRYGFNRNRGNFNQRSQYSNSQNWDQYQNAPWPQYQNDQNFSNQVSNQNYYQNQGFDQQEVSVDQNNSTIPFAKIVCHSCGFPNHTSRNCTTRPRGNNRGTQNPFNMAPKN